MNTVVSVSARISPTDVAAIAPKLSTSVLGTTNMSTSVTGYWMICATMPTITLSSR